MSDGHFLDTSTIVPVSLPPPGRAAVQARWDDQTKRLVVVPYGTSVPIAKPGTPFIPLPKDIAVWGVRRERVAAAQGRGVTQDAVLEAIGAWPPNEDYYGPIGHLAKLGWWVSLDHDGPYYILTDWDGHTEMEERRVTLATSVIQAQPKIHLPKHLRPPPGTPRTPRSN